MHQIIYIIIILIAFFTTYWVFIKCINNKNDLSQTIALGSIFATFGSSIVAIFSLYMGTVYDRFLSNMMVMFRQIEPGKEWQRWAFIKRKSHQVLFNGQSAYQVLTNAEIEFNVGSHNVKLYIPTIKEDFFDLPNWKAWLMMKKEAKNYESYVLNKSDNPANALMMWDCIYDNFCSIVKYKIAKSLVVLENHILLLVF